MEANVGLVLEFGVQQHVRHHAGTHVHARDLLLQLAGALLDLHHRRWTHARGRVRS